MHLSMHISMHICMHKYLHVCMHIYMHCECIYMHICMHIYTRIYICIMDIPVFIDTKTRYNDICKNTYKIYIIHACICSSIHIYCTYIYAYILAWKKERKKSLSSCLLNQHARFLFLLFYILVALECLSLCLLNLCRTSTEPQ